MQIVSELRIADNHIFVGLSSVLTETEMNSFYKEASQRQVQIICLDRSEAVLSCNDYALVLHVDDDYEEQIIQPKTHFIMI